MLGVDMHVSLEVVLAMFDNVWWIVHSLLTSLFENKHLLSVDSLCECLSILQSSIGAAIFLGLEKERLAFMLLLSQFKTMYETSNQISSSTSSGSMNSSLSSSPSKHANNLSSGSSVGGVSGGNIHASRLMSASKDKWFYALKNATASEGMDMMAMHLIPIITQLRLNVENDFDTALMAQEMKEAVSTLENAQHLIDGRRYFVKQGDLIKVARSGSKKMYRFILFSDQLIYAAKSTFSSSGSLYRIHNCLLLSHIKIDFDIFDDRSFHLTHPLKSFMVVADNKDEREDWVKSIMETSLLCRPNDISLREEAEDDISLHE
jgi:hypothetical protein